MAPRTPPRPIRIATVYRPEHLTALEATDMSEIRWVRISEALASLGYEVDMVLNIAGGGAPGVRGPRVVPYDQAEWGRYDVIKTLFHKGFASLCAAGAEDHPFVISKLGSVVGHADGIDGVHFFGAERAELYEIQERLARRSRYVTVLTDASKRLWEREFGGGDRCLLVPTGVDRTIPSPARNPYAAFSEPVAVYLGTVYTTTQREVNLRWQATLNALGRLLRRRGVRLCLVGPGSVERLDREAVTYLGPVENDRIWDYQYFAKVGIALAQGPVQHNESSKIYYYLRTGLPVVAEAPIPNCDLIGAAGLGFVAPYGDEAAMADMIAEAAHAAWDREAAIRYVLEHHTWERRAAVYDRVIRAELGRGP